MIRVESEVGKGTTFRILLPSEGTAARETRDTTGREQLHGSSDATVLIVEDEAPLRVAVKKMLGKAGFARSKLPTALRQSNYSIQRPQE